MSERTLDGSRDGRLSRKPSGAYLGDRLLTATDLRVAGSAASCIVWPAAESNPLMVERTFVQDIALGTLHAPAW
jgi:hypothetical protein